MPDQTIDLFTESIIGAAIEVHKALGPGLLESAYESCLAFELTQRGFDVIQQHPLPLTYKAIKMDCGYRIDLFVNHKVIIEIKSVQKILPIHEAQLMSYLKLSGCSVGLLLNFNSMRLIDGITRRVMNHPE